MRHYFKCFVWKTSFHPFISSVVIDVIMLIVTDEETKAQSHQVSSQSHTAHEWQSWGLNPECAHCLFGELAFISVFSPRFSLWMVFGAFPHRFLLATSHFLPRTFSLDSPMSLPETTILLVTLAQILESTLTKADFLLLRISGFLN